MSAQDYRAVDADPYPLDVAEDLLDDYPNMPDHHRRGIRVPAVKRTGDVASYWQPSFVSESTPDPLRGYPEAA